jgi:DUF1680 family protein
MKTMLQPLALQPLTLGSIRPAGWLKNQLRIQADGLTGHLDEFWRDVAESGWIGGKGEGWERGPYWLDGIVPLAFLLDDERLKAKVQRWMDYVLSHQHEDGWIGPVRDEARGYRACDPWPVTVFLKAAIQYFGATGDERVPAAMTRFFRKLERLLDRQMLFDWNRMRWQDLALCVHWFFDRTGEPWLFDLALRLRRQGFDWLRQTQEFPFKQRTETGRWAYESHVVNYAMAMKHPGVCFRQSGDPEDRNGAKLMIETLDRFHGQANGVFTGDENLAGLNPSQGTELCAVVEYLFSLETLISILGEPEFGDRLEKIAFNALPATFKPDMWAHQYDQQVNQVVCKVSEERVYTTNGPHSNIFGLEPGYGCCTANMHQGWPKFAAHLWMKTPDQGLAAIAYPPCAVSTCVAGQPVAVKVQTDYPFGGTVRMTVTARSPVRMPLALRIPGWATEATVSVGDGAPAHAKPGTFCRIDREWSGSTSVELHFPMRLRSERRFSSSIVLTRGPLVFSLKIGEDWRQISGELPHADWEVYPTTPWNYALAIDEGDLEGCVAVDTKPVGDCPFSPDGAPVRLQVQGRRLESWGLERNAAAPPPPSPVSSPSPLEPLALIPYGCTNLRVTEIPTLA